MKKAFTLIELLVVIAIIAILAAILFPVFAQAKEAAKKTQCLSNQKNLSLGIIMYTNDYDDSFMPGQSGTRGGAYACEVDLDNQTDWTAAVYPYIKNGSGGAEKIAQPGLNQYNGGVFNCPTFPFQKQDNQYGVHNSIFVDNDNASWNCNGGVFVPHAVYTTTFIDQPANKAMLVEKGANGGATDNWNQFVTDEVYWVNPVLWNTLPASCAVDDASIALDQDETSQWLWAWTGSGTKQGGALYPRFRHSTASNVAHFDGHVKAYHKGGLLYCHNIYIPGTGQVL